MAARTDNITLQNALMSMYVSCGSLDDAVNVFSTMTERDVISWNIVIGGHVEHNQPRGAVQLLDQMLERRNSEPIPDAVTALQALKACAALGERELQRGQQIHRLTLRGAWHVKIPLPLSVGNALIHMYACCNSPQGSRGVRGHGPARYHILECTAISLPRSWPTQRGSPTI